MVFNATDNNIKLYRGG